MGPPRRTRCRVNPSRIPRHLDVVGVWHGTPYQVASVSSTTNGVIVACGPAGTHTTHPKTGHHRHTERKRHAQGQSGALASLKQPPVHASGGSPPFGPA